MTICSHCPLWLPRMQDLESLTLCSHAFPGWGRECSSSYFDHKGGQYIQKEHRRIIINNSNLSVGYLNATIKRTTWDVKPEIGPNRCSHTRRNLRVDGFGAGFGPPRHSGAAFWTKREPNWTVFPVQSRTTGGLPGPDANTHPRSNKMERPGSFPFGAGSLRLRRCDTLHTTKNS